MNPLSRLLLPLICLALPALAQDIPLPRPRPEPPPPAGQPWGLDAGAELFAAMSRPMVPLPRPRPDRDAAQAAAEPATDPAAEPSEQPVAPTEPEAPPRVYQTACPALLSGLVEAKPLPPLSEAGTACGTQSPLAVTAVLANGRMIPLSTAATLDCGMASVVPGWVAEVDSWLRARENTGIAEVLVSTSYMCRNVNNASGGNLSFHAFADALDVMGFELEDGRTVLVEGGWADALSAEGRMLRFAHGAACSRFTTTLGPEANALHENHFHLDLGCHGRTCTARLCE